MYFVYLTSEAEADLDEISDYTLERWGGSQLQVYMPGLRKTIYSLDTDPHIRGQDRSEILKGMRSLIHENHYHIFYRIKGQTVEILRALHHKRNWQNLLNPP